MFANVGFREGITTVEADIMSEQQGVKSVVEQVRKGELPAFQHVFSAGELPFHLHIDALSVLADQGG